MVLSSQTVNVLRYAALGTGVLYGLYHQRSLTKQARQSNVEAEIHRKEQLIKQAKAEWKKRHPPPPVSGDLVTDPDDSRFDLEAFLQRLADDPKSIA